MALKGIKRALDSSPPEKRKKLVRAFAKNYLRLVLYIVATIYSSDHIIVAMAIILLALLEYHC